MKRPGWVAMGVVGVGLACGLGAAAGCIPSAKKLVRGFTFAPESTCPDPRPPGELPGKDRQWELVIDASISPSLVVGYDAPAAVGACLDTIGVTTPSTVGALWAVGRCQALKALTEPHGWMYCAKARLPVELRDTPAGPLPELPCPLSASDHVRLSYALVEAGQALYEIGRSELPTASGLWGDGLEPLVPAALSALGHARRLIAAEPPAPSSASAAVAVRPRAWHPSLALSGGAANGAFTAGYLFTLLTLRERALAALADDGSPSSSRLAARERIRLDERFGHLVGTSVGSLLAALVDLYFEDVSHKGALPASERLDDSTRAHLAACLGAPPGPLGATRPAQACALSLMRAEFTRHQEWHHLCAEQADLEDLFDGCASSLMRFDVLRRRLIEPFMAELGAVVAGNDVVRASLAVDLLQNLVVALDERGCAGIGSDYRGRCMTESIMASISEPVFASRVDRVWSGLRGDSGEYGLWLDGGLRSGTPSLRALQLTDWPRSSLGSGSSRRGATRVLAINTNPMHGSVEPNVAGAFPVMFRSIDQLVEGTRQWELAATNTYGAYLLMTIGGLADEPASGAGAGVASPAPAEGDAGVAGEGSADGGPADGGATDGADGGTGADAGPDAEVAGSALLLSAGTAGRSRARLIRSMPGLLSRGGLVRAVFVPSLLPPAGDGAGGYQFDPVTMLRLFLLGERSFLEGDPKAVLRGLGWNEVAGWLSAARLASLRADAARRAERYDRWMADEAAVDRYGARREESFDQCFVECCEQELPLEAECDEDILAGAGLADLRPRMFFDPMP